MDRNTEYRISVRRVLQEIADMMPSEGSLQTELVCDESIGHYQLGEVGWEGERRIDNVYLHIDVIKDSVWVQHNGTEFRIGDLLMREGVPRESIVLAFHHPDLRVYTDFAAA